MSVIVVTILFSLLVALGFLLAFVWAVKSGQYDDKVTPSYRVLNDEKLTSKK
ncbi:cbb3-type cytochrome oxidase assembly protein CcoS [Calditrichota bacterium]